jgi:hypothetical protein
MKKLFLLLLTLASTNVLFGARPGKGRTPSETTDPITDHVRREPATAQRPAAPNAGQFGHFRVQAPQAQRAPVNTRTAQNMGTQTMPLIYVNVQQQLLMDRATASAAAVILFRLKHT